METQQIPELNEVRVPLFKHRKPYMNIVLSKGEIIMFVAHKYWTQDQKKIDELLKMAANREAGVYIDENDKDLDINATTPYEIMKAKIIKEYLTDQRTRRVVNAGNSNQNGAVPIQVAAQVAGRVDLLEQLELDQNALEEQAARIMSMESPVGAATIPPVKTPEAVSITGANQGTLSPIEKLKLAAQQKQAAN